MMNKLIIVVLAFAIAAPALADDLVEAPFRNLPGSTFSEWTYDDGVGVYDWYNPDFPENSWYVSHPDKEDPADWNSDPCNPTGFFGAQVWGLSSGENWDDPCNPYIVGDPCGPLWADALPMGRQGGVNWHIASWDLNNFVAEGPSAKDIWVQMTYFNGDVEPSEMWFGSGGFGMVPGDPCGAPMGMYEGLLSEWGGTPEPLYTWMDLADPCDPCSMAEWGWGEWPLSEWDPCTPSPDPLYTWDTSEEHEGEFWSDGEQVTWSLTSDGYIHEVWAITLDSNPDFEWVEGGFGDAVVVLDQIVIETLCYVPEPATMVLLGLGSLMMIRRKKK